MHALHRPKGDRRGRRFVKGFGPFFERREDRWAVKGN